MRQKTFILSSFIATSIFSGTLQAGLLSASHQKEIGDFVRNYLRKNPEVIEESLQELQKKREIEKQEKLKKLIKENHGSLYNSEEDPILGNPKGQTQIVAFLDPICGYCRKFWTELEESAEKNKDLKVIIKDIPYLGPSALLFTRVALAAHLQGKYHIVYEALRKTGSTTDEKVLLAALKKLKVEGLDLHKLQKDLTSEEVKKRIERNLRLAGGLGINATP